MTILVYTDEGAGPISLRLLLKSLKQEGYLYQKIDRKGIVEKSWEEDASLLIFPGGRDIFYHQALKGEGNRRIRSYVEQGGSYFGICAGGYYGCSAIEFEKGHSLEVIGNRELAFFPGLARGSAFGPNQFRYESEEGACAAELISETNCTVYFNGGCVFENASSYNNIQVVAKYKNLPSQPAAVIECQVNKGRALLSGVHPEFNAHLLPASVPSGVRETLLHGESERKQFFQSLMQRILPIS